MPGGDRTGPRGVGPMTGRGAGLCAGYDVPGFMEPGRGRGFGRGGGRGFQGGGHGGRRQYDMTGFPGWTRGLEHTYRQPAVTRDSTGALANLKEQARHFRGILGDIEARIAELRREGRETHEGQRGETDQETT